MGERKLDGVQFSGGCEGMEIPLIWQTLDIIVDVIDSSR